MQHSILLVDDEISITQALTRLLRKEGYRIRTANSGEQALQELEEHEVQLIICDQRMPQMKGTELLQIVKEKYPNVVRIMLSGYCDFAALTEAVNTGEIHRFINKPWDNNELRDEVRYALEQVERRSALTLRQNLFAQHCQPLLFVDIDGAILDHTESALNALPDLKTSNSLYDLMYLADGRPIQKVLSSCDKQPWYGNAILKGFASSEANDRTLYLQISPIQDSENQFLIRIFSQGNNSEFYSVYKNELFKAISGHEIQFLYDPIVNVKDGTLAGADSIMLWDHNRRGLLTWDSISSGTDLLELSYELSVHSVLDLLICNNQMLKDCKVFMKIPASQFNNTVLFDDLLGILMYENYSNENLVLEIPENTVLNDLGKTREKLTQLRDQGVRISLDKVGVASHSMLYLSELPVDYLKIDAHLSAGVNINQRSAMVISHLLDLGTSLGVGVIATGIETQEVSDKLLSLGCHQQQGALFGCGMRRDMFRQLLKDKNRSIA